MALTIRRHLFTAVSSLRSPLIKSPALFSRLTYRQLHSSLVTMAAEGDTPTIFDKILSKEVHRCLPLFLAISDRNALCYA